LAIDHKDVIGWLIDATAVIAAGIAVAFAWKANGISQGSNAIAQRALELQNAPAALSVSVADPIWIVEQPAKGATSIPIVVATVTATNDGAQQGCLSDLIFVVRVPLTNDEKRFAPLYFMDSREVLLALAKPRPVHEARKAQFGPIVILGKQQITEVISFYAGGMDKSEFTPGSYLASLIGSECSAPSKWRTLWTATYIFAPDEIQRLLSGVPATHTSEERRKAVRSAAPQ